MDKYVAKKIDHMRRIGVVSTNSSGTGKNGGAAPDWMTEQQKKDK